MIGTSLRLRFGILVLAALLAPAWPHQAAAQVVETPDGRRVVIGPGGTVQIQGPEGRATVTSEGVVASEWRASGTVLAPSEVDQVLADLGGVVLEDRIQLTLGDSILFDFDSAAIRPDAARTLHRVAGVIRARAADRVFIVGHTDSKGSEAYNRKLSQRRAVAVKRWLEANEGVPASLMTAQGVGAAYPVAPNRRPDGSDNPEGRARNRRVEIQIATRPGVTLGPGTIVVEPGRVTAPGVVVDGGGVSAGGTRVSFGTGSTSARSDTVDTTGTGADPCTRLCALVKGRHGAGVIGCMESTLEELDFEMDAEACNELENAMFLGSPGAGTLCTACRNGEGWTETACAEVLVRCFGG